MFKATRLIHLPDSDAAASDALVRDLRELTSSLAPHRSLIQPTLPGVRNGGDVLMHLQFAEQTAWHEAERDVETLLDAHGATKVDGVEYHGSADGFAEPRSSGSVYRTLLLRVAPDTPEPAVERFEADLLRMPRHISTIRAWQLSRVTRSTGASPWTHVWEQEFTDLDGLNGPYLMHPVHWAHVDRWFDPEHPDVIVRDRVCHSFCPSEEAVLS